MKKIGLLLLCLALLLTLTASSGLAKGNVEWTYCFYDVNYTPELQVNLEGNVIRGQAILSGNPSFPAPLTGYRFGGKVFFTIAYLNETGVRFYEISQSTMGGTTWGIYNSDSSYYDLPHSAQLYPCVQGKPAGGETGAFK